MYAGGGINDDELSIGSSHPEEEEEDEEQRLLDEYIASASASPLKRLFSQPNCTLRILPLFIVAALIAGSVVLGLYLTRSSPCPGLTTGSSCLSCISGYYVNASESVDSDGRCIGRIPCLFFVSCEGQHPVLICFLGACRVHL
jgi:hypothetical protein